MDAKFTMTKVKTDERMVVDLPVPGLTEKDVTVKYVPVNGVVIIKIDSTVEEGVAFRKKLIDLKDKKVVEVDTEYFNIENMKVSLENGLLRISIPKTADAIGRAVFPNN